MAASRSPRSLAFQERQARKSRSLSDKAQARLTPAFARGMSDYFAGLAGRIEEALETGQKADPAYNLFSTLDADPFWNNEKDLLGKVVQKNTIKAGIAGVAGSRVFMGQATVFDLPNPVAKEMTWRIGRQITGINDETRARVQKTIKDGIDAGSHPSVIAKNLREQARGWAGLENLTASRAYTIARTETAHAYNWGALLEYKRSGIVKKVICHDAPDCGWVGHNGSELANGTHRTLAEAGAQPVSHPNCVRAFSPAFGTEEPGVRKRPDPNAPPKPAIDPAIWANPKKFGTGHGAGLSPLEEWSHDVWARGKNRIDDATAKVYGGSLEDYGGAGYRQINRFLRSGASGVTRHGARAEDAARNIASYIDVMSTPEAAVVHRGIGSGRSVLGLNPAHVSRDAIEIAASRVVGQTFTEDAFMSTALNKSAAFSGTQLELTVPKGYKAIPVSYEAKKPLGVQQGMIGETLGKAMAEAELLLQKGARYVIDRYEISASGHSVRLIGRVLPEGAP